MEKNIEDLIKQVQDYSNLFYVGGGSTDAHTSDFYNDLNTLIEAIHNKELQKRLEIIREYEDILEALI